MRRPRARLHRCPATPRPRTLHCNPAPSEPATAPPRAVALRGRITAITLKGEDLIAADEVAEQISLDQAREARLAEEVGDRIRAKFGPDAIRPATTRLRVS